jgi:hypothetical protein
VTGTLRGIEKAADAVEGRTGSLEELAAGMRPMGSDPDREHAWGMVKWLQRRRRWVTTALVAAMALMPEKLEGREPTLKDFREALQVEWVLEALREQLGAQLAQVPAPLGLGSEREDAAGLRSPQSTGPDPPGELA